MTANLNPYSQMKDSGVEWLGEVPEHWKVRRLKSVAHQISDQTYGHQEHAPYVALEHVESGTGRVSPQVLETTDSQLKRFKSGDILFGKLRPYLAKVVRANFSGLCVSEFLVLRATECISERYLEHLLRSKSAIDWINSSTFGARMPRADWQFVGNTNLPLPSLSEQTAIANFLNDAIGQIESYIRAKEKLIALLEEQKKVIIHDAVTGRIDVRTGKPYSAYKPSSIDWLQEIPTHWERKRLKYLLKLVDQRSTTGEETLLSLRRDYGIVVFADHFSHPPQGNSLVGYKIVDFGQLVVNRLQANNGLIFCSRLRGLVSPDYSVFQSQTPVNMHFLSEILRTSSARAHFRRQATGLGTGSSGFLRLYDDKFLNTSVALPPVEDQDQIVEYIDQLTVRVNESIHRTSRQIEAMRDYRTRLIADVVTGKLDVREAAETLPDDVAEANP